MKKSKLFTVLGVIICIGLSGCSNADVEESSQTTETVTEEKEMNGEGEIIDGEREMNGGRGGNQRGGGMGTENDAESAAVISENSSKFTQDTFTDSETGITLEYSLYVPENYDETENYPLLMYIPDSTAVGKSAYELVEEYYGANVWITEEDQSKHASFVVVPVFTDTVVTDNWETSDQIEVAVKLIDQLKGTYSIDENRLYTTGQSMGCMTSLYLNSKYPDLFAASLFVSGQWNISVLQGLEQEKFFYIVAGGDQKASGGQDEVMEMFDADNVKYSYGTWDAQNTQEEQNAEVEKLIAEGCNANMIRFETGSVFKDGESGMEHMASFNYGYKIQVVRDWLFEQTK